MKLSKTSLLILGIGLFVAVFFGLYRTYSKQTAEQATLSSNLTTTQGILARLVAQKATIDGNVTQLQDQLNQAKSVLDKAQSVFPRVAESVEYDERLYAIADNFSVEIVSLTVSEPSTQTVESVTLSTTSFSMSLKGKVENLLAFIHYVNSDSYFSTSSLKGANVSLPKPLSEEKKEQMTPEEIEAALRGSASVEFTVYIRPR